MLNKVLIIFLISFFFQVKSSYTFSSQNDDLVLNHLIMKNGKQEKVLDKGYILENDKVFVETDIIENFFSLKSTLFNSLNKLTISDDRASVHVLLYTPYVMYGSSLFHGNDLFFEKNGKKYYSEELVNEVFPRLSNNKLSVARGYKKKDFIIGSINSTGEKAVLERIVIDPGHGGEDEGAVFEKLKEKDISLELARKLKLYIEANSKIKVFLTRDKDEFVPLNARKKLAEEARANLFISLHVNASETNFDASGFEVFILDPSNTDEEALLMAKVENSVMKFEDENFEEPLVQDILQDIKSSSFKDDSMTFAQILYENIKTYRKRGIKQAPFVVLNGHEMPSVLVELGFISNKTDRVKMSNLTDNLDVVKNIFYSVLEFKKKFDEKYKN